MIPEPTESTAAARAGDLVRASAPGRVNLIGEHTDYNDGLVLPVAIRQRVTVELRRRADRSVTARTAASPDVVSFRLGEEVRRSDWSDYVAGVTQALAADGHELPGFDLAIASDVPVGSGLSSSAALLVALLRGLGELASLELDPVAIALLAQRAENGLVGAQVGIMDQMASSLATTEEAIYLDCRDLRFERIPLPPGVAIGIIHSGVEHAHATGGYNTRRSECARACELLGVGSLRDVGPDDLDAVAALPEPYGRRARHVITENERVRAAVEALRGGDVHRLGSLFDASHVSMRDDYEISAPDVDRLVEIARADPRVLGARMTGGGFGGSVVLLAEPGTAAAAVRGIAAAYAATTGRTPRVIEPEAPGELLPAGGHRSMPWRNGGGVTREVAREPVAPEGGPDAGASDDPDWRISLAEVAAGGPFSTFPGVDRVLVRIGPGGMVLTVDGVEHELERFVPLSFPGEAETTARLPEGATRDLNVMTRRGLAEARVDVREVGAGMRATAAAGVELVLVVVDGAVAVEAPGGAIRLELEDALRLPGPVDLALVGEGRVAVVELGRPGLAEA